jgi:branched-chain amino acid aminotransferase
MTLTMEEFMAAVKKLVEVNELEECYIRPLVIRGYGQLGVNPLKSPVNSIIAAWKWGAYLGEEALKHGMAARISSFARTHVNNVPTKAKATGAYLNSIMAKIEAVNDGYQEAIMLDTNGHLSEGTGENLFVVEKGKVRTPSDSSILPGITRDTVITLLTDHGHEVFQGQLTRGVLYCAEEAFFTGTAAEITPIREVDRRKIGIECPGKITREVQDLFFKVVRGELPQYHRWLTWVG